MSAAAVMRRSNRRSARGTSNVAFFTNVLAGLMVLRGSIISRHACLASVLLDARSLFCPRLGHIGPLTTIKRAPTFVLRGSAKAQSLVIKRCHTQIGNSRKCLKSTQLYASGVYAAHRRLGAGVSA